MKCDLFYKIHPHFKPNISQKSLLGLHDNWMPIIKKCQKLELVQRKEQHNLLANAGW